MGYPNTLIFVDFPSDDPEASARFYEQVFGWEVEGRPAGVFHRIVPGQEFLKDGEPSGVGNLHMESTTSPTPAPPEPRRSRAARSAHRGPLPAHVDPGQR